MPVGDLCVLHLDPNNISNSENLCKPINKSKFIAVPYQRGANGEYKMPIKDLNSQINTSPDSWANIQVFINTLRANSLR